MANSINIPIHPNNQQPAIGNFVSAIKNHDISRRLSPQDQLGVQTLGRNVGLALEQLQFALSLGLTLTLTSAEISQLIPDSSADKAVTLLGVVVSY